MATAASRRVPPDAAVGYTVRNSSWQVGVRPRCMQAPCWDARRSEVAVKGRTETSALEVSPAEPGNRSFVARQRGEQRQERLRLGKRVGDDPREIG